MYLGDLMDNIDPLPANGNLLGLDLGTKTMGLAVSGPGRGYAVPLPTLRRTKFAADAAALVGICGDKSVSGLVIGWPLNMDGSAGPACDRTLSFVREFQAYTQGLGKNYWITLWDERLSTQAGEGMLDNSVDKSNLDSIAAQLILTGFLDRLAGAGGSQA